MDIPQIPTDSLYKFLAISGLIVTIGFFIVPSYFEYEINVKIIKMEGELAVKEVDVDFNTKDIQKLKSKLKVAQENGKKLSKQSISLLNKVEEKNVINMRIVTKFKSDLKLLEHYAFQLDRLKNIKQFGLVISFTAMIIGFFLWYIKVQKPLDQKIIE